MRIAVLGNLTIDEFHKVDTLPSKNNATLVKETKHFFGGRAVNIANALMELDCDVSLHAIAGADFITSGYSSYLIRKGLKTDQIDIYTDQQCARFVIYGDPEGGNYSFFHPNVEREYYGKLLQTERDYSKYDIICLARIGGENETVSFLNRISSHPQLALALSLGPEVRRCTPKLAQKIVKSVNYLFMNQNEENEMLSILSLSAPQEIIDLSKGTIRALIVTRSASGSYIYSSGNNEALFVSAVNPDFVINSLGAGDGYVGGFLYGLDKGWNLEKCGKIASTISSFILQEEGAQFSSVGKAEIFKRLSEIRTN